MNNRIINRIKYAQRNAADFDANKLKNLKTIYDILNYLKQFLEFPDYIDSILYKSVEKTVYGNEKLINDLINKLVEPIPENTNIRQAANSIARKIFIELMDKLANQICIRANKTLKIDALKQFATYPFQVEKKFDMYIFYPVSDYLLDYIYANDKFVEKFMDYNKLFTTEKSKNNLKKWLKKSIQEALADSDNEDMDLSLKDIIRRLIIEHNLKDFKDLNQFINGNIKSIVDQNFAAFFYSVPDLYLYLKNKNIILDTDSISTSGLFKNIVNNIDLKFLADTLCNELRKIDKTVLFNQFVDDPFNFINFNDDIDKNNIVYSTRSPINFSSDRSGPLIIIGSEVLRGNNSDLKHHDDLVTKYKEEHGIAIDEDDRAAYTEGYDPFKNVGVGVGSYFGKVALLEYVANDSVQDLEVEEGSVINNNGNAEQIKNALIADDFTKVYINNNQAWTSKEYKRLAKLKAKKIATIVNGQIQSLDDLNDDSIKLGDTIKVHNTCMADLNSANTVAYAYINGNFIRGDTFNTMRETHNNLFEKYRKDMQLHVHDQKKQSAKEWYYTSDNELMKMAVSFIKYDNIIFVYPNTTNYNLFQSIVSYVHSAFNCRVFIINNNCTELTRLAHKKGKHYELYRIY